jgi:hypothetical protein
LFAKLKEYISTFNLFPSIPPSSDEHEFRTQRISTALFIFLLILSITILLLYTSLIGVTKTINVQTPKLEEHEQLYSTYPQTLKCSCTNISINYGKFIRIKYTLHQVCSSVFVTQNWFDYLHRNNQTFYLVDDFRHTGSSAFQALSAFCDLINNTIFDSLTQFYSNQYISESITPLKLFETETQSLADQFRSSMTNSFLLSLSMIRNTAQGNALYSALQTNYVMHPHPDINFEERSYKGCDCSASSGCIDQASIYDLSGGERLFNVSNFYTGCYVIESLLQSSLECFYNQTCINGIQKYLSSSSSMIVKPLNLSLLSESLENSTIQELLDRLMIEEWNSSQLYDRYYNVCNPKQCTYILETRNDAIYIVTTLIGIAGGLIRVLKFVVPRLVKIVRKKKERSRSITGKSKSKRGK